VKVSTPPKLHEPAKDGSGAAPLSVGASADIAAATATTAIA
jgi:hypothetical protein